MYRDRIVNLTQSPDWNLFFLYFLKIYVGKTVENHHQHDYFEPLILYVFGTDAITSVCIRKFKYTYVKYAKFDAQSNAVSVRSISHRVIPVLPSKMYFTGREVVHFCAYKMIIHYQMYDFVLFFFLFTLVCKKHSIFLRNIFLFFMRMRACAIYLMYRFAILQDI